MEPRGARRGREVVRKETRRSIVFFCFFLVGWLVGFEEKSVRGGEGG